MIIHTDRGSGPPQTAPSSLSAHYIDLETGDEYYAKGMAEVADWERRPRQADLDNKVDVVAGKGLSTNDYSDLDKQRVAASAVATVLRVSTSDGVTAVIPAGALTAGEDVRDSSDLAVTIPSGITAVVEVTFQFSSYAQNVTAQNEITIFPQIILDGMVVSPAVESEKLIGYIQNRVGKQTRLRMVLAGDGIEHTLKFRAKSIWNGFSNPSEVQYRLNGIVMTVMHAVG